VSGDLGAAYVGLQLLEREMAVYYGQLYDLNKEMEASKRDGTYELKSSKFKDQSS
jgi:thiamine-monophosphate kinase